MFELHIKGFKTLEAAKQFWDWFGGSGEQYIDIWWTDRQDEGLDVGKSPMTHYAEVNNNCVIGHITN